MAKIYGQLEKAQFENIAGTSTTPTPTGRVYCDTTNPLAAVPMFYNGSTWKTLLTGQAALVVQNSGTACTVNWANGLYQQVKLTGNCLISLSNPQQGQIHTLVVTQQELVPYASNALPYVYKLNTIDQAVRRGPIQPLYTLQASESAIHAWFYSAAIKPAYNNVGAPPTANPVPANNANVGCVEINHYTGLALFNQGASPFIQIRTFKDAVYRYLTWGPLNPVTPATLVFAGGACYGLEYQPDGFQLFSCGSTTPFIGGNLVDVYGNPTTIFSNPGVLPAGARFCVSVHPLGTHVAVSGTTTPFIEIYPILNGAFGTKLANPTPLPNAASSSAACAFSPFGDYIAVSINTNSPFLQMYAFNAITGWGAQVAALSPGLANGPGAGTGKQLAWRPQGDMLAMLTQSTSPYVQVVGFNRGTGAWGAISQPYFLGAPAAQCMGLAWSPCGCYLAIVSQTSPFLFVYDMSAGTGFPPASGPLTLDQTPLAANDVKWTANGEWLIMALNVSPYLLALPAPRTAKSYLRIVE